MVVPPTPLHTSRVLMEDKELWEDVKVKARLLSWLNHTVAVLPLACWVPLNTSRLTPGGTDQRPGDDASRLWPGEDQGPGFVQQPLAVQATAETYNWGG